MCNAHGCCNFWSELMLFFVIFDAQVKGKVTFMEVLLKFTQGFSLELIELHTIFHLRLHLFLALLADGNWHPQSNISNKLGKF